MSHSSHSPLIPLTQPLAALMKAQGFHGRMMEFSLQQQWSAIVGPHIAGHTFPEGIRHGKLFLLAENSVWLQQLLFLKAELLAKIGCAMGRDLVTDIIFRVGMIPAVDAAPLDVDRRIEATDPPNVGRDLAASIEESIRGIPNEILLERLRALFVKSAIAGNVTSVVRSEKVF